MLKTFSASFSPSNIYQSGINEIIITQPRLFHIYKPGLFFVQHFLIDCICLTFLLSLGMGLEVFSVYSTAGSPHGLTRYVGTAKYTRESEAGGYKYWKYRRRNTNGKAEKYKQRIGGNVKQA